jgi:hypothetical protein
LGIAWTLPVDEEHNEMGSCKNWTNKIPDFLKWIEWNRWYEQVE